MVDKDDLFQEEDGIDPQDHGGEEPSSDEDDEIFELLDVVETPEVDDEIIDLTETVTEDEPEDEAIDLLDMVEMAVDDMDVSDLDDNNLNASDRVEFFAEEDEEVFDLTEEAEASDVDDEIHDLTETVAEDEIMDLAEPVEPSEPEKEELAAEAATTLSAGYEEDKELLELIDDIQATLNDEPVAADISNREETAEDIESSGTNIHAEAAEAYTFLDDDEFIDDEDIPEAETEFVDHLGIDLTSEIERKALKEMEEAAMEDVKPPEGMGLTISPDSIETAVKQALTDMLADEDNLLVKAIETAVKKALGQRGDT